MKKREELAGKIRLAFLSKLEEAANKAETLKKIRPSGGLVKLNSSNLSWDDGKKLPSELIETASGYFNGKGWRCSYSTEEIYSTTKEDPDDAKYYDFIHVFRLKPLKR